MTGLNPALHENVFWTDFAKISHSAATVYVEIFQKEKNWGGFRPIPVTHWKEFEISLEKRRFQIFQTSQLSRSI